MPAQDKDPQRTRQAAQIIKRHLKSEQPADVARALSIPPAQVNRQLALARKRWQESRSVGLAEAARLLVEIDQMEEVFLRAWSRHGLPGAELTKISENEDISPAEPDNYLQSLETAALCLRRRTRLRGARGKDASQAVMSDPLDDMSEEEVDRELERLSHELELRGTKASS